MTWIQKLLLSLRGREHFQVGVEEGYISPRLTPEQIARVKAEYKKR